jgi:hypothetical protein
MLGLIVLSYYFAYIAVAVYLGRWVYRQTGKRWQQALVAALVLWLPLWDILPGYVLFLHAKHKYGGVRIYERVKAEGYLDRTCYGCEDRWTNLAQDPYRYIEVHIPRPDFTTAQRADLRLPILIPGYYQFSAPKLTPEQCRIEEQPPDRRSYYVRDEWKNWTPPSNYLRDICVIAQRRDRPVSRYQYTHLSNSKLPDYPDWIPVWSSWDKMIDLKTDRVIAQFHYLSFYSWLYSEWDRNYYLVWQYPSFGSDRESLEIADVIQPSNVSDGE